MPLFPSMLWESSLPLRSLKQVWCDIGIKEARYPNVFSTIIIPVFVPRHWWEDLLHNQTALFLRQALRSKRSRVITTVRFYLLTEVNTNLLLKSCYKDRA